MGWEALSQTVRSDRRRQSGTAKVEYMVLLAGLLAISLSAHPPFALRLSHGLCVFTLGISGNDVPAESICRDRSLWESYGIAPPIDSPYLGEEPPEETPCGPGPGSPGPSLTIDPENQLEDACGSFFGDSG